jgi:hypothetical protein
MNLLEMLGGGGNTSQPKLDITSSGPRNVFNGIDVQIIKMRFQTGNSLYNLTVLLKDYLRYASRQYNRALLQKNFPTILIMYIFA